VPLIQVVLKVVKSVLLEAVEHGLSGTQELAPSKEWEPGAHCSQLDEPMLAAYVPAGQVLQ